MSYDVTTPLGKHRCETEQEISARIAAYMETEGATLNHVAIVRVPETGNTTVIDELSPAFFWTPPEEERPAGETGRP